MKINKIINEEIEKLADDIYKNSLDDSYWKEISTKFPDYNCPDSTDHKKAVEFILNKMKVKNPELNSNTIEKLIKNKISDGTT
jgi:protein-tyrosine phosphatase